VLGSALCLTLHYVLLRFMLSHCFQVLEATSNKVNVNFIDYGNKDIAQVRQVERADCEFFSFPPLAERFAVAGLCPSNRVSWIQAEYELLQKKLLNADFVAEVIADGVTGFPPLVSLLNVDFVSPSSSLVARWPSVAAAQQFAVGKCYTVLVTHYESVLNFWVQDSCIQDSLDRFHAKLAGFIEAGKSRCLEPKHCWPGNLCIARYKGSDQFYRAVITEFNSRGSYRVTFIDYGDSATVNISDLWPIDKTLLASPVQAVRCCVTEQSASLGASKLRSAFTNGCPIFIRISAVSSVHHLVDMNFDSHSAVGQPVVQLPSPVGLTAAVSTPSIPRYVESNLAEGMWHSVVVSSVEQDGSFYLQRLDDASSLNVVMVELSKMPLPPMTGAVVDGMACIVCSPTDGCVYRAHVCITSSSLSSSSLRPNLKGNRSGFLHGSFIRTNTLPEYD